MTQPKEPTPWSELARGQQYHVVLAATDGSLHGGFISEFVDFLWDDEKFPRPLAHSSWWDNGVTLTESTAATYYECE